MTPLRQVALCFIDVPHYILKWNAVKRVNGSDLFASILRDISPLQSDYHCLPVINPSVPCAAEPHVPLSWPQPCSLIWSYHITVSAGQPRYRWLRRAQLYTLRFGAAVPPRRAGRLAKVRDLRALPKSCRFFW